MLAEMALFTGFGIFFQFAPRFLGQPFSASNAFNCRHGQINQQVNETVVDNCNIVQLLSGGDCRSVINLAIRLGCAVPDKRSRILHPFSCTRGGCFPLRTFACHATTQRIIADQLQLNDLVGFIVAFVALRVRPPPCSSRQKLTNSKASQREDAPPQLSFGWQRATLLGAFFNGVFLLALGVSIFLQAIERFVAIQGRFMMS